MARTMAPMTVTAAPVKENNTTRKVLRSMRSGLCVRVARNRVSHRAQRPAIWASWDAGLRPLHMQQGKRPPARVRGRPPHHGEPERLVEPQPGFVLLVDIHRQRARRKTLRLRHEELASPLPVVVRVDEQRFNRVVREAQKADRTFRSGHQHPPVDGAAGQLLRHEGAQRSDVTLREEVMRGANGPFPHLEQALTVLRARGSYLHVHSRIVQTASTASGDHLPAIIRTPAPSARTAMMSDKPLKLR